jgi:ABC-type protease/lipase transport system fused ATPase/permease subunit
VLLLSTSFYMLVVYDRILPSRSVTDLAVLTGLVAALHMAFAILDWIRARVMCRVGLGFVEILDGYVLERARDGRGGLALLDDVERVRRFLISAGPCALFDALWLPVFLIAVFLVHPVLGLFAVPERSCWPECSSRPKSVSGRPAQRSCGHATTATFWSETWARTGYQGIVSGVRIRSSIGARFRVPIRS